MFYSYVQDNTIIQPYIKKGAVWQGRKLGLLSDDDTYRSIDLWPHVGGQPSYDPSTQTLQGPELVVDAAQQNVNLVWTVTDIPLASLKIRKLAELNAYAKTKEEEGITLPNGFFARTDAKTQIRLTQAMQQTQINPDVTFDWKLADGSWTVLDATQIAQIQGAVLAHVQACFTREKELAETINACASLEQLQATDINAGWPE